MIIRRQIPFSTNQCGYTETITHQAAKEMFKQYEANPILTANFNYNRIIGKIIDIEIKSTGVIISAEIVDSVMKRTIEAYPLFPLKFEIAYRVLKDEWVRYNFMTKLLAWLRRRKLPKRIITSAELIEITMPFGT